MTVKVLEDHVRIRGHIAHLREFAGRLLPPVAGEGLGSCRWALARDVMQNLVRKEQRIYFVLAQDPRPAAVATAAQFHEILEAGVTRFLDHMEKWPASAVANRWGEYRAAVLPLLAMLEARMVDEEEALFPLVDADYRTARPAEA